MSDTPHPVTPLGLFGFVWGQPEFEKLRDDILPLVGMLPKEECPAIARYLRAGAIVFAVMEVTSDVIGAFPEPRRDLPRYGVHTLDVKGGRFAVAGGSAIDTDGTYCWRGDTADYVEHYRVGLPEEFLRHGRSLGWVPPTMTPEDVLAVDDYLVQHGDELREAVLARSTRARFPSTGGE
jgi:hypothetical protein